MGTDAFVAPGTEKYRRYVAAAAANGKGEDAEQQYDGAPESFEEELMREMQGMGEGRGDGFEGREGDGEGFELPKSPNFGGKKGGRGDDGASRAR